MNQLHQIDAFKKVLADYHLSDEARAILARTKLVLLVGPTSSGRNTIINELVETDEFHYIVSDTTRQPRSNNGVMEQNGREYWFRTEDEILEELQAGNFLEAAIIHNQQVSGISIRELSDASGEGKTAINEIEVVGADNIHAAKPDAFFFFVVPPSFDEWMMRIHTRGTLPDDELKRRLESAVKEISMALERDYYCFVVNDTFKHSAREIQAIVAGADRPDDAQVRSIASEVLEDTKKFLASVS